MMPLMSGIAGELANTIDVIDHGRLALSIFNRPGIGGWPSPRTSLMASAQARIFLLDSLGRSRWLRLLRCLLRSRASEEPARKPRRPASMVKPALSYFGKGPNDLI